MDIGCDVVFETGIAVRTEAHLLTIHIDRGVHIDTVELEEELLTFHFLTFHFKGFPIPADAARQCTATSTAGVACIEVALDSPVVRQVELSPEGVMILG